MPLMTTRGNPFDRIALTIIPAVQSTGAVPQRLARPIAIGGLVFFLDALLYFAYRYAFVFAREMPGATNTLPIAVDVLLFTLFALHHSLFARDTIRKRITRIVGALERSTYVWIASALFIAVCAWWQPVAGVAWQIYEPAFAWLMYSAQMVGLWLILRSALMIDFLELAGVRQVQRDDGGRVLSDPAVAFKTSGPYGWVRHPIYSGWFLLLFAVPHMTTTRLIFAVTSSSYLLIAIPLEERSLRHSSSGAYDQYMREVRWKLLPRVF
jgi:protein-S-isoprenylcysteine O-methyltransferase Ste14